MEEGICIGKNFPLSSAQFGAQFQKQTSFSPQLASCASPIPACNLSPEVSAGHWCVSGWHTSAGQCCQGPSASGLTGNATNGTEVTPEPHAVPHRNHSRNHSESFQLLLLLRSPVRVVRESKCHFFIVLEKVGQKFVWLTLLFFPFSFLSSAHWSANLRHYPFLWSHLFEGEGSRKQMAGGNPPQ